MSRRLTDADTLRFRPLFPTPCLEAGAEGEVLVDLEGAELRVGHGDPQLRVALVDRLPTKVTLGARGRQLDVHGLGDGGLDAGHHSARESRDTLGVLDTHGGEVERAEEQKRHCDHPAPRHESLRALRHEGRGESNAVLVAELDDQQDEPDGNDHDGHAGVGELAESPAHEHGAEADPAQNETNRLNPGAVLFELLVDEQDDRQQDKGHPGDHEALLDGHQPLAGVLLEQRGDRHRAVLERLVHVVDAAVHPRQDLEAHEAEEQDDDEQQEEDEETPGVEEQLAHARPALLLGLQAGRQSVEQTVLPVLQPHFGVRDRVIHTVGREEPPDVQARRQGQERLAGLLEPLDLFPAQHGELDHVLGVLAGVGDHLLEGNRVVVEAKRVGRQDVAGLTLVPETQVLVDLELREHLDDFEVEPLVFDLEVRDCSVSTTLAEALGNDLDLDPALLQLLAEAVRADRVAVELGQDVEHVALVDHVVLARRVHAHLVDELGPLGADPELALVRVLVYHLVLRLELGLHVLHLGVLLPEHERQRPGRRAQQGGEEELRAAVQILAGHDVLGTEAQADQADVRRNPVDQAGHRAGDPLLLQQVGQVDRPEPLLELLLGDVGGTTDEHPLGSGADTGLFTKQIGHWTPHAG